MNLQEHTTAQKIVTTIQIIFPLRYYFSEMKSLLSKFNEQNNYIGISLYFLRLVDILQLQQVASTSSQELFRAPFFSGVFTSVSVFRKWNLQHESTTLSNFIFQVYIENDGG
ncbi:hypothetical protein ACJX0J_031474, partial [Zea mays]